MSEISRTKIPDSKRILFLGDSVTDDGKYIAYMDMYFRYHMPDKKLDFINLGVSSETASGLSEPDHPFKRPCVHERIDRALSESKPDWVVVCYGINDGIYYPFSEQRFNAYKIGIINIINKIRNIGAEIILMTPPPFDGKSMINTTLLPDNAEKFSYMEPFRDYDNVMEVYSNWILNEMKKEVDRVVDIRTPIKHYIETKRSTNPDYISGDGIHPNAQGHWIMTKALIKALFNISLEQEPYYIMNPQASPVFTLLMERFLLLSSAWKEHVGHSNPYKAESMPLTEALCLSSEMAEGIKELVLDQKSKHTPNVTTWKGYERYDGFLDGREFILIKPKNPLPGNQWIWRAEFFDAFPQVDMEMLDKGWYLAYYRISDLYGCPEAIDRMVKFHGYMTEEYQLASKAIIFGFSRGGLYAFNYAAEYPQHVAALYLDAPVLDIRSWPGGKGSGIGSTDEWQDCLEIYGLNEYTIQSFEGNPLDKMHAVASASIPIIVVAGDADDVVPFEENSAILVNEFKKTGGRIKLILKRGVGHHPHSLEDPEEIVEYLTSVSSDN